MNSEVNCRIPGLISLICITPDGSGMAIFCFEWGTKYQERMFYLLPALDAPFYRRYIS